MSLERPFPMEPHSPRDSPRDWHLCIHHSTQPYLLVNDVLGPPFCTILHHSAPPCFTRFASHHSSSHAVDTSVVYMGDAISGVVRMGDDGRSGLGHANSEAVRTGDNSALVHPNSVIGITVPWYEYPRTGTQFTICQYHAQVCQVYMLR